MNTNMNHEETDLLVQRFVDQELSAEERVRFVSRLGRDEALRQRAIELEQLVLTTARLPKPRVPDNFVSAVLARTAAEAPASNTAWLRRWSDAFWAPRRLQWNYASAAAMACMAFIVVGSIFALQVKSQAPAPSSASATGPTAAAPVSPQVLVRLVVVQPAAQTVQVAGDFNGWNPSRTPLEQITNGAWAVTIPLKPGRYEYMFVVDGNKWIADPFAAEHNEDGFGSRNAVLDVRAPSEAQL